jgi:hypothetical protein
VGILRRIARRTLGRPRFRTGLPNHQTHPIEWGIGVWGLGYGGRKEKKNFFLLFVLHIKIFFIFAGDNISKYEHENEYEHRVRGTGWRKSKPAFSPSPIPHTPYFPLYPIPCTPIPH